ncbi:hypothetical protein GALMADRAFT_84824 [Galerina marginata CBS 339.88]|uniref:Uncharacterized protein n=1 Tax=Galerina marginata (strain CBS 339.88) TaxID=685588 RepID=A0A067TR73_GALM3|nr:hypothetical protein GALMADRAFT_84824 [Galerina marginata CBS 339.88]
MPSKSVLGLSERGQTSSPTLRIRSKVSNLAKAAAESSPTASSPGSSVSPPLFPSARLANPPRTRAPSTSSAVGQQQSQQQLSPPPPTSPPPQFYPITTAVPAANPHRFASNRPPAARSSPPTAHHVFQSFSQPSSATLHSDQGSSSSSSRPRSASAFLNLNGTGTATAKVDPASIPLPPHSPPASAVSFSSRSSVSRSSASVSYLGPGTGTESPSTDGGSQRGLSVKQQQQQSTPDNLRATLDNLMQYTSGLADDDEGDSGHDRETDGELVGAEEHKVKAAAKSNRKIADLEITNRSLLAINASLEATKHRQAKEIHELRRKLRESRLILPPRAYRDVKSSLGPAELEDDEEDVDDDDDDEEEEDEEEGGGDGDEGVDGDVSGKGGKGKGKGDEIYKRVRVMLDALLKSGQAALERQVKDFPEGGRGAAKVLSPEELKDWRGTNGIEQDNEHEHEHDEHDTALDNSGLEPESRTQEGLEAHGQEGDYSHIHIPRKEDEDEGDHDVGNDTITSEDEVEAMTIPAFSPSSSPPPPPILITQPS